MTLSPTSYPPSTSWINDWLPFRDKIVLALTSTADHLSGHPTKKLLRVADEIAFAEKESDILRNPLALEIFLTLSETSSVDQNPEGAQESTFISGEQEAVAQVSVAGNEMSNFEEDLHMGVEHAVNEVLLSHFPVQVARQRLLTMIAYPLLVLLICVVILVFTSVLPLQTFKMMFNEFGLHVPAITRLLFAVAGIVSSPWTYFLFGLLLLCVVVLRGQQWRRFWPWSKDSFANSTGVNLRGRELRSKRGVCGDWAWHISLLMRAGLGKADAIELAGDSSNRDWLRRDSKRWAQEMRGGKNPFVSITQIHGLACPLLTDILALDFSTDAQSAGRTGKVELPVDQAGVLRDIAELYWDRTQPRSISHLGCLSQLFYMGILFAIGFTVMALFAPMVQLITGLS